MINLLLPAVSSGAECLQRTTLVVVADESSTLPVLTELLWVIVKEVRLAPEVLPVMRILALSLVVLNGQVGAPLRLEVVHVEVVVLGVLVDQASFQVLLCVGERADLTVGAVLGVTRAERRLVLLHMIESFSITVRHVALIATLAGLALVILAEVGGVYTVFPAPVKLRMKVLTHLVLMHATYAALGHLEHV